MNVMTELFGGFAVVFGVISIVVGAIWALAPSNGGLIAVGLAGLGVILFFGGLEELGVLDLSKVK